MKTMVKWVVGLGIVAMSYQGVINAADLSQMQENGKESMENATLQDMRATTKLSSNKNVYMDNIDEERMFQNRDRILRRGNEHQSSLINGSLEKVQIIQISKKQKSAVRKQGVKEASSSIKESRDSNNEQVQKTEPKNSNRVVQKNTNTLVSRGGNTKSARALSSAKKHDTELVLLAKVIHMEAQSEPFEGKLAVANVIMNRVKSSEFPNSITAVINQSGQFPYVAAGSLNNVKPNAEDITAARKAIAGENVVQESLYFFSIKRNKNQWLSSRPFVKDIGGHRFVK